jgi:sugar lactone lactonase YvrE
MMIRIPPSSVQVCIAAWIWCCAVAAAGGEAVIGTVAGTGRPENNGHQGKASDVNMGDPFGVEIGPEGALYVTEVRNHRVWRIDRKSGEAKVVAGCGEKGYSGDGGPATQARLNEPYEVRFDDAGNLYFVEMQNHLVRRVDAKTGVISTVAGTGEAGFAGDGGPALAAKFRQPHSIALDGAGGLYVADIGNHRIRRIDLERGTIETIAGSDQRRLPQDGQAARGNPILGPRALFIRDGVMWIALREGHSVWRMEMKDGVLRHVAGSGARGYDGDGGPAVNAKFNGPKGIALDAAGNIYLADTENQAIRRIDGKSGLVTTLAGNGEEGYGGDEGPATMARLARPHGICVDGDGVVYVGDTLNHRVREVRP